MTMEEADLARMRSKRATAQNLNKPRPWETSGRARGVTRHPPEQERRVHVLYQRSCIRCGTKDVDLGWREIRNGHCWGGLDG